MTTTAPGERAAPPRARRRGLEGAGDMIRSIGLVLLVVVLLWFLARPGGDAEQTLRVVDQGPDVTAWTGSVEGALVPSRQLPGWRPTVSQLRADAVLRLGWVTASDRYAEFASTSGPRGPFLEQVVGNDPPEGSVDVGGSPWTRYTQDDGSISLVREADDVIVVVGTQRSTAPLEELVALAGTVAPTGR